jgi:DNA end-binding protein Ku
VSCPVSLYKTTTDEKNPTWDTAGPNGGVLHQEAVGVIEEAAEEKDSPMEDPGSDAPPVSAEEAFARAAEQPAIATVTRALFEEGTGQQVEPDEVRRGIRGEDGSFVDLTDGLEAIKERCKLEEMKVVDFIRVEEVRRERVVGSYYVAPDGPGAPKVVRLLHEAMRETKRVAVVKFTKRTKQSLGVLVPHPASKSLVLIEMAWAEDCRELPDRVQVPGQVDVAADEVAVAVELVQAMAGKRADSLDILTDDARDMRRDLIARAERGEVFEPPTRIEAQPDADLLDALRASMDTDVLAAA